MSLKRVHPGDGPYPAADFNTIISSAEAWQAGEATRGGRGGRALPAEFDGTVLVKNDSGANRTRFQILAITDILVNPDNNLQEFQREPAFVCSLPSDDSAKCVVLLEPIASGDLGWAMLAGRTAVQIDMIASTDQYATPIAGDASKLRSGATGPFRILWAKPGTGTKWAAVYFPASGSSAPRRFFRIIAAEGTTPPFIYSAIEVERDNSTHAFTTKSGGVTIIANLRNIAETQYPGAGKIPVNQTVEAFQQGTEWLCEVLTYRGVYPYNG